MIVIGFTLWMAVGAGNPSDYKLLAAAVSAGPGGCPAPRHRWLVRGTGSDPARVVALLHRYGYDAAAFTEFQIVMLVLTMSGLLVGVVVSERQRADLAAREAEERLKEMQAQAARAARINLVSGMASALAHEINQPMTAARALARSVQQILRSPDADLQRADTNLSGVIAQIDHAGGVVRRMREFLRRGQPHFSTLERRKRCWTMPSFSPGQTPRPTGSPSSSTSPTACRRSSATASSSSRLSSTSCTMPWRPSSKQAVPTAASASAPIGSQREPTVEIGVLDNGGGVSPGLHAV